MKINRCIKETKEAFIFECELNEMEGISEDPLLTTCALMKATGEVLISLQEMAKLLGYKDSEDLLFSDFGLDCFNSRNK